MAINLGAALRDLIQAEDVAQNGGTLFFGERIYPQYRQQMDDAPAAIYQITSGRGFGTFEPEACSLAMRRVTYTVAAEEYADAETGIDLIRFALDGFQGFQLGIYIQGIHFAQPSDDYQPPSDAAGRGWHLANHDYEVFYTQPIPA